MLAFSSSQPLRFVLLLLKDMFFVELCIYRCDGKTQRRKMCVGHGINLLVLVNTQKLTVNQEYNLVCLWGC